MAFSRSIFDPLGDFMFHKQGLVLAAVSFSAVLGGCASMSNDVAPWGPDVLAVTASGKLIGVNHGQPGDVQSSAKISGMAAGESPVAIAFRPTDGKLYALGSAGGLYTVDTATGMAAAKSKLSTALSGSSFDIGFNAADGTLRVVSDAGQNLAVDADSGAATVDSTFAPKPALLGVAYTSDAVSHLYAINSATKEIDVVPQPASGKLVTVGTFGSDTDKFDSFGGFDIIGNESSGKAYAAMSTTEATGSKLYMIKLGAGAAKSQGTIGGGEKVRSIALVPMHKG